MPVDQFLAKTINHTVENAFANHPKNRPFCVTFGKKKGFELSPNQMLQTCAEFGISWVSQCNDCFQLFFRSELSKISWRIPPISAWQNFECFKQPHNSSIQLFLRSEFLKNCRIPPFSATDQSKLVKSTKRIWNKRSWL